jgi:hypothetical protein
MASSPACIALAASMVFAAACASHDVPIVDPVLSPTLEVQADAQAHAAMPEGQRVPGVLVGVAYAPSQATDWSVPLQLGRCYAFGYSTDTSVTRFGVAIWSPSGKRVDNPHVRSRGRPPEGVQNLCATEEGAYRVEGKVGAGAGHFAVVSYATSGAPSAAAVRPPGP